MPVTTERARITPKSALAIAGSGLLLLLFLPAVLTALPNGLSVGRHGIRAAYSRTYGVPEGPWSIKSILSTTGNECFSVGWGANSYRLEYW